MIGRNPSDRDENVQQSISRPPSSSRMDYDDDCDEDYNDDGVLNGLHTGRKLLPNAPNSER